MPNTVYQRAGSPNWWFSVTVPGRKRIRRSSGSPRKDIAQKLADRLEAAEWKRRTDGDEATLTFAEAVMIYRQAGKATEYLKPLTLHFKDRRVASIKPGDLQAAGRLLYPGCSPATQNRQAIVPARAVINHCAELGMCPHMKVKMFKESPPVRRAVDADWLARFRDVAPPHLGALALFMASTGARIGQAIDIAWENVDLSRGEVVIPAAKGFPERIAYLSPPIVAALANIRGRKHRLRTHRSRHLVFGLTSRSSVYRDWKAACKTADIPYVPPHQSGRHTFFTKLIVTDRVDVKTAAVLGGSASPQLLLKTYTHPQEGREVINRAFGTIEAQSDLPDQAKPLDQKAK